MRHSEADNAGIDFFIRKKNEEVSLQVKSGGPDYKFEGSDHVRINGDRENQEGTIDSILKTLGW